MENGATIKLCPVCARAVSTPGYLQKCEGCEAHFHSSCEGKQKTSEVPYVSTVKLK